MERKRLWIALAAAPVMAAFLAAPQASVAAKHHVKCEIIRSGKTETKEVATAKECTDMGGKVVTPKAPKKY